MNIRRVFVLLGKEIRHTSKNFIFVFAVVLPIVLTLVVTLLFGSLFSGKPKLGINDQGSSKLAAMLVDTDALLSKEYNSDDDLRSAVETGAVDFGLIIPQQFDASLESGKEAQLSGYIWGESLLKNRAGLSEARSLSEIVGLILYIFILLVSIVAALDALDITAITIPMTQMLNTIINVIPNLIGAAIVLVLAFYIGRLVADLIRDLLSGIGLDTVPEKLGVTWSGTTTLSQWVGYLLLVAIMLFATVSAAEMLGSDALTGILNVFIAFFWKVVLAVIIFGIGLYFANLAYRAVMKTGTNQANFIARMAQIAIVIFAAAIALREIGVANEIINLAFGITLAAIALAIALAFGLGTQKIAERELDSFLTKMRTPKDGD